MMVWMYRTVLGESPSSGAALAACWASRRSIAATAWRETSSILNEGSELSMSAICWLVLPFARASWAASTASSLNRRRPVAGTTRPESSKLR